MPTPREVWAAGDWPSLSKLVVIPGEATAAAAAVGPGDRAEARAVVLGDRSGPNWVVDQGLKPGDRVIVDGLMTLRPGAPVRPQPYSDQRTAKN